MKNYASITEFVNYELAEADVIRMDQGTEMILRAARDFAKKQTAEGLTCKVLEAILDYKLENGMEILDC